MEIGLGIVFLLFFLIFAVGGTGLWVWMLVDAIQVPDDSFYKSGNKTTWVIVVALLGGIGAAVYFFAGRPPKEMRPQIAAYKAGYPGGDQGLYQGRYQGGGPTQPPPYQGGDAATYLGDTTQPPPPPAPPTGWNG